DDFVDALRTGRRPAGDVHSNVYSLAMVEATVLSAESERTVVLDPLLEQAYAAAIANERRDDINAVLESWGSAANGLATDERASVA
ncbi:MAG: gfo/Idh/MocA family oxidoreductase, partial [Humibacter sp.]